MALIGADLQIIHRIGDFNTWRYDTVDTIATVEAASYFTRTASFDNFQDRLVAVEVGDTIEVYIWTTTILTGVFIEKKVYKVSAVTAAGVATIVAQNEAIVVGAGATVTQITSRATGVTINALSGQITGDNSSLAAAAEATFIVTNSRVAAIDVVCVSLASGATADTSNVSYLNVLKPPIIRTRRKSEPESATNFLLY